MHQIIPARMIAFGVVLLTITIIVLLDAGSAATVPAKVRYTILAIDVLLLLITWKPVWRFLWRVTPFPSRYFPDLNGEYDVELRHNWPIQRKLLEAASDREAVFDPRSPERTIPPLGSTHIRASIDLSFYWVRVKVWSDESEEPSNVIRDSRTLTANLIRACDGEPNRLAYIYRQRNRRDRQTVTDDSVFEGAAILDVEGDGRTLRGEYWTNRSWQQGLSTAGEIVFRKRRK